MEQKLKKKHYLDDEISIPDDDPFINPGPWDHVRLKSRIKRRAGRPHKMFIRRKLPIVQAGEEEKMAVQDEEDIMNKLNIHSIFNEAMKIANEQQINKSLGRIQSPVHYSKMNILFNELNTAEMQRRPIMEPLENNLRMTPAKNPKKTFPENALNPDNIFKPENLSNELNIIEEQKNPTPLENNFGMPKKPRFPPLLSNPLQNQPILLNPPTLPNQPIFVDLTSPAHIPHLMTSQSKSPAQLIINPPNLPNSKKLNNKHN